MYDLLIKGGQVIDPYQRLNDKRDIAITQDKIKVVDHNIPTKEAKKVIDIKDKIVIPGLIDMHAHVTDGLTLHGIDPEEEGILSGVTTICDAGSTGYANFYGFKKFIIEKAQTDILCFLALHPTGQAVLPESWDIDIINRKATVKTIQENKGIIKGLKIRIVGSVLKSVGLDLITKAMDIAVETGLPLVVHIGKDPIEKDDSEAMESVTKEVLKYMRKGDILSHIYTPKNGKAIKADSGPLPELTDAIERGIILDLAQGSGNLSFEIVKKAIEIGIKPTVLSTDASTYHVDRGNLLTRLMSKMMALGLSLEEVIEMTTINPAIILGVEKGKGSLEQGRCADISILSMNKGKYTFNDSLKQAINGSVLLKPEITIKSGIIKH